MGNGITQVCSHAGEPVRRLMGHASAVCHLAFAGDGSVLASASHDGAVRVWNASGECMAVFDMFVGSIALSPDASVLAVVLRFEGEIVFVRLDSGAVAKRVGFDRPLRVRFASTYATIYVSQDLSPREQPLSKLVV